MIIASLADWAKDAVSTGGYPVLAGLILLENLFPPLPSELILPLAGFYVGRGEMSFIPALLASTAGSVIGALILYAIARRGGRPLILRFGKILRVDENDLDRADGWFDRYGSWIVLLGRLVPGARSLVSLPAGLSEMPLGRFVALTAIGSTVWNAALIGAGQALGSNYERVGSVVGPVSTVVVAVAAVVILILGVMHFRRRAKRA